jgi:hypothetical protein
MEDEVAYKTNRNPYTAPGKKDIDDVVSEVFEINKKKMYTRTRKREVVNARQVAMWFQEKYTNQSLSAIAMPYGRDHATVLHAKKAVNNFIETEPSFREKVRMVERMALPKAPAVPPPPKTITLTLRSFKRLVYRHYIRGSREAFWVTGTYDQLPSIGKYRRMKSFLKGLEGVEGLKG